VTLSQKNLKENKIMSNDKISLNVRTAVRDRYSKIAETFEIGSQADCGCGTSSSPCCGDEKEKTAPLATVEKLYETADAAALPEDVTGLSLGCGDPITLAALKLGETVLDLGSGGGIDCFLQNQIRRR